MNIKNKSINFQTICYLVVFSTTILLALWFFQILFLRVFYERYQIKTMQKISQEIQKYDDNDLLELEELAYENDICIELDLGSEALSFNTKMPTCILNSSSSLLENYKYELLNMKKDINTLKLVNKKYEVKGLLSAIKKDDGIIYAYANLEDVHATSIVLRNQLIYITLLAIIISCLLALYISKKLTRPIVDITKKAKNLGNKNLEFTKSGIREIDELAENLNNANMEIMKIDELRRDLMANVSHDLKTPLTMIKAYAEMIRDFSYKDKDKRDNHLAIIIDETDRLNMLVNDILLLSKAQARVESLKIEEYDLIKEIKGILKKYEIMKETEDYKLTLIAPAKVKVKADKNKLNQVIYNLINNAINYTGKNKDVIIEVVKQNTSYLIAIKDSGKGIKKEEINYIWDKYYKNEKNHQRNVVGTGLGLSIVKAILEEHKFKYGVKSQKNKGTTFYFEIPK